MITAFDSCLQFYCCLNLTHRPLPALSASAVKIAKSFYIPVIKLFYFVFLCSILTDDGFRCLPLHLLVTKNPLLGIQLLVSQERVIYRGTILVRPLLGASVRSGKIPNPVHYNVCTCRKELLECSPFQFRSELCSSLHSGFQQTPDLCREDVEFFLRHNLFRYY